MKKRYTFIGSLCSPAAADHARQHLPSAVTLSAFSVNALPFGGVFPSGDCHKKPVVAGRRRQQRAVVVVVVVVLVVVVVVVVIVVVVVFVAGTWC